MVHSLIMTIGSWSALLLNILINLQPVGVIPTRTRTSGFRVTFSTTIWRRSLYMPPVIRPKFLSGQICGPIMGSSIEKVSIWLAKELLGLADLKKYLAVLKFMPLQCESYDQITRLWCCVFCEHLHWMTLTTSSASTSNRYNEKFFFSEKNISDWNEF